jgi:ubiquinone/menaquinone biosynthesis C-methylase UbiE
MDMLLKKGNQTAASHETRYFQRSKLLRIFRGDMSDSLCQSSKGIHDYVCPSCKGELELRQETLVCLPCQVSYPIINGIHDFIWEDLPHSSNPVFRRLWAFDVLAPVYESLFWYNLFIHLVGGLGSTSQREMVRNIADMVHMDEGTILDVACGPGILSRHIASSSVFVHGIDASMGMLRRGVFYTKRDQIVNMQFARAKAEELPFGPALFHAAICGGALHLFRDPLLALREIGRTMREGAPLVVTTLISGQKGILRFPPVRRYAEQHHGIHVFEIDELEQHLSDSGFERLEPKIYGSLLLFRARRARVTGYRKEGAL